VFEFLRATGVPVAVVDLHARPDDPRLAGVRFVKGDCRNPQILEQVGAADAHGILIVTSDDLVNVSTALLAHRLNPNGRIVVRMFNQTLIPRLGSAIQNITALSVSALTAPLLALTALTGESLGAFRLGDDARQIAEVPVAADSDLIGRRLAELAGEYRLFVLAHATRDKTHRLHGVAGDSALSPGDRLVVCGRPDDLERLLAFGRGDLLPGVLWAGRLRRGWRTLRQTLAAVDLSVRLGTAALFLTLFVSTLVFRFGLNAGWADGLYQTVSIVATGSELHGENKPAWAKVFLSVLKIAGAALIAAFTAIFTQYLLRARLGGAFEVRRIPDGGHVVVCGLGNVGFRCVEELVRMGRPVVAVERVNDNPFAATVRRMGVPVIIGDATVAEVLRQARADTARAVLAATSSELANLEIALLVRERNPAQRVVVRLSDPDFAQAVREAAAIRFAVSVPALAAPAFAAALFGDRVQTLVSAGGRTLAVVELLVHPDDPCLHDALLSTAMVEYRFLPVAVSGLEPFAAWGVPSEYRLKDGDRLTAVIELPDLERLLRRERAEV
jgi:Trk K+ transport system NAD-binding subunit